MRQQRFSHGLVVALVLSLYLVLATAACAGDLIELTRLDAGQLSQKITAYQKALERSPQDQETLKALGVSYHIKAGNDREKFSPLALKYLTRAHEADKTDYAVMGYLGSAICGMAKTTWNPLKKKAYVLEGTLLMNEAVEKAPDNMTVRWIRGKTSMSLPAILWKGDPALVDFEHLAALIEQNPDTYDWLKEKVTDTLARLRKQ